MSEFHNLDVRWIKWYLKTFDFTGSNKLRWGVLMLNFILIEGIVMRERAILKRSRRSDLIRDSSLESSAKCLSLTTYGGRVVGPIVFSHSLLVKQWTTFSKVFKCTADQRLIAGEEYERTGWIQISNNITKHDASFGRKSLKNMFINLQHFYERI